ncbi:PTS-dependent dihydroxyacetone kinase, ADP-binding subunit DhaL [Moorella thermoacetica]|uniref:phosphoenolpyruvate--glycerone phosphotransferase n=1 Tax=Neomoorella thermoacetica TaxID=1525 RepID=A0A1J5JH52_NEOTH|nr:dihydroxyacetone kinase subunit DhaL [Moorella thermoacetica]OIQ08140.1 PTS-dependent dihydroxyacetone kinase, ADP-binding subunit DhaL [Moorella thermoacetica]
MVVLTVQRLRDWFLFTADLIEDKKNYLSELDRALGDGDHGVTMSIGWQAVKNKLQEFTEVKECGELLKTVGMTFLSAVGSSVGPLYATAFLRAANVVQGKTEMNDADIIEFWNAFVKGIQERGKAEVGEKTMVDFWVPAIEALRKAQGEGKDLIASLQAAEEAGKEGMLATKDMLSKKGRSSRLGERSLGHMDPGASSAHIIFSSFVDFIAKLNG